MSESLLAIFLVTSSARGASLVYRWPPSPVVPPRLSRPRPIQYGTLKCELDNPWKATHCTSFDEARAEDRDVHHGPPAFDDDEEYEWKRPNASRSRSMSSHRHHHHHHSASNPSSGRNSPSDDRETDGSPKDYDEVFGYSAEFLAGLLCPQLSLCHQKFELIVDDLAFLGHPVCAEKEGLWSFKPEKSKPASRGRDSRNPSLKNDAPPIEEQASHREPISCQSSWLQAFHLVLVMDLPDPSSSASGNVSKYFNIVYEQIAYTVTAVLFQEQVLSNFVEKESEALGHLKEICIKKGEPILNYVTQALGISSIAPAMKAIYEAVKSNSMAHITIHALPLELQLPPFLDFLLHSEEDNDTEQFNCSDDEGEDNQWGIDTSFGWRLPALAPWKALLLLDGQSALDPSMNLFGPHVDPSERSLAEGLLKFLETASVSLSLADMGLLLDWDLETRVFPTVRWLVHHRRAKVVDIVHAGLKTMFTLPPKFQSPLSQLTAEFAAEFTHPSVPPLPSILSVISNSQSKQSDNHFFAAVVRSKDLVPLYQDIVIWMLKRDMLVTLHLRIRVVATEALKLRVRLERERARARKSRINGRLGVQNRNQRSGQRESWKMEKDRGRKESRHRGSLREEDNAGRGYGGSSATWLALSPRAARNYSRRISSNESSLSRLSDLSIGEDDEGNGDEKEDEGLDYEEDDEKDGSEEEHEHKEGSISPSIVNDPGRATPLQRRWLSAMSDGKDPIIARRFEQINQYFDGKRTDDEILYKTEISRKQLREVLHLYEEFVKRFLFVFSSTES